MTTAANAPRRAGRPRKVARPVAPAVAEEALMQSVLDLCQYMHLRAVHFPPAYTPAGDVLTHYRGDGNGWPDLHIVGPGGVLYRELKAEAGVVTPEQQQYLADLRAAGQDADVWRPADLRSGRIHRELKAISRPRPTTT